MKDRGNGMDPEWTEMEWTGGMEWKWNGPDSNGMDGPEGLDLTGMDQRKTTGPSPFGQHHRRQPARSGRHIRPRDADQVCRRRSRRWVTTAPDVFSTVKNLSILVSALQDSTRCCVSSTRTSPTSPAYSPTTRARCDRGPGPQRRGRRGCRPSSRITGRRWAPHRTSWLASRRPSTTTSTTSNRCCTSPRTRCRTT